MKKLRNGAVYIITTSILLIASAYVNILQSNNIRFWKSNTLENFLEGYSKIVLVSKSNFSSATGLSIENQGVGIITQTVPGLRRMGIKGSESLSQDLLIAVNNPSDKRYATFISNFYRNFAGISSIPANKISTSEFQGAISNTISNTIHKAPKQ